MGEPFDKIVPLSDSGDRAVRSAAPVRRVGDPGEQARGGGQGGHGHGRRRPSGDQVDVHAAGQVARRLLRERVLAATRAQLELGDGEFVPNFAEALDREPVAAFVGRLLGAQNQLAALRAHAWSPAELRENLDLALRRGVTEVLDMLQQDMLQPDGDAGVDGTEFVAQVLGEYGRRLSALVDEG